MIEICQAKGCGFVGNIYANGLLLCEDHYLNYLHKVLTKKENKIRLELEGKKIA